MFGLQRSSRNRTDTAPSYVSNRTGKLVYPYFDFVHSYVCITWLVLALIVLFLFTITMGVKKSLINAYMKVWRMVGPSNLFMPLGFSKFLLQTIHYEAALRGHCNQAPIATIPFILASLRKCPRVSNLLTPLHFICECCTSAVLI